jgi:hypothetical protein
MNWENDHLLGFRLKKSSYITTYKNSIASAAKRCLRVCPLTKPRVALNMASSLLSVSFARAYKIDGAITLVESRL